MVYDTRNWWRRPVQLPIGTHHPYSPLHPHCRMPPTQAKLTHRPSIKAPATYAARTLRISASRINHLPLRLAQRSTVSADRPSSPVATGWDGNTFLAPLAARDESGFWRCTLSASPCPRAGLRSETAGPSAGGNKDWSLRVLHHIQRDGSSCSAGFWSRGLRGHILEWSSARTSREWPAKLLICGRKS